MKTTYLHQLRYDHSSEKAYLTLFMLAPGLKLEEFDMEQAMRAAVKEFLETPQAKESVKNNNGYFNWGDAIINVPDELWKKHGLIYMESVMPFTVDHDENLTTED